MSFSSLLIHRATLQHQTALEDNYGQRKNTWTTYASGVNCRWYSPRGTETTGDATKDVKMDKHIVFMPTTAQLNEGDRIGAIAEINTTVLVTELDVKHIYQVSNGAGGGHHLEVHCEKVRGSTNV